MLRKTMALVCLLVSGTATAEAIKIDGCAELARIVYDEVQSSVLHGPAGAGPWYINPGQGEIHVCRTAARTVSRAFTLAAQSAGLTVDWDERRGGGRYCLSGFLSQCYPGTRSLSGSVGGYSPLGPIWLRVSQAVMSEMYNPYSSDEVRFRTDDLRLRLGLSLRSIPRH